MVTFNNKSEPKKEGKNEKRNTLDSVNVIYEGWELTLNAFKSGMFSIKATKDEVIKILSSKQMVQRLSIALGHSKAGNTSEKLLNKIRQIIYSLYRAKEITKKYITI